MFPNMLIVGTMKSGSSSLAGYLNQHPEVYVHPDEINFFGDERQFARGREWYSRQFAGAENKAVVGEKTNAYSYVAQSAGRIRDLLPNAKLIWILRNPVERAYSNYWYNVSQGHERLDFETTLKLEPERIQRDIFKGYIKRGIYVEQVKRFLECFPLTQMHFMLFEKLASDPQCALKLCFDFLGVDLPVRQMSPVVARITWTPQNRDLQYAARKLGLRRLPLAWKMVNKINRLRRGYAPMNVELRERLAEYYRPHNKELGRVTGLDVSVWDSG